MSMHLTSYRELLAESFKAANRKVGLLAGTIIALIIFAALCCVILFAIGGIFIYWVFKAVPPWLQNTLYFLLILAFFYVLLKLNAAISFCYAQLSVEQSDKKILSLAINAWKKGLGYFLNSMYAGIFLFAGQSLAICPCFLLQTNFAFSPYLYIYEGKKGMAARARSKEITNGFGWLILQRTVAYLLIGYFVLFLLLATLLIPWRSPWYGQWFFVAIVIIAFYASLVQSQFIRQIYLESIFLHEKGNEVLSDLKKSGFKKWPAATLALMAFAVILYYGVKISLILLERK